MWRNAASPMCPLEDDQLEKELIERHTVQYFHVYLYGSPVRSWSHLYACRASTSARLVRRILTLRTVQEKVGE